MKTDLNITDFEAGMSQEQAEEALRRYNSHEALVEALKEAQHYILTRKGKEFNIKDSEYFHISVVLTQALKLAEGEA